MWPDGHVDPDPGVQANRCWQIALAALAELGGSAEHVVRTRQYVTNPKVAEAVGDAHAEVFGRIRPASTMVVVAALLDARWLVEVELDAVIPAGVKRQSRGTWRSRTPRSAAVSRSSSRPRRRRLHIR